MELQINKEPIEQGLLMKLKHYVYPILEIGRAHV